MEDAGEAALARRRWRGSAGEPALANRLKARKPARDDLAGTWNAACFYATASMPRECFLSLARLETVQVFAVWWISAAHPPSDLAQSLDV